MSSFLAEAELQNEKYEGATGDPPLGPCALSCRSILKCSRIENL